MIMYVTFEEVIDVVREEFFVDNFGIDVEDANV